MDKIADYDEEDPEAYNTACLDDYEWLIAGYNFMSLDKRADGHYYLTVYRAALKEFLDKLDADLQEIMKLPRKERPEWKVDYYVNGDDSGFYIYEDGTYNTLNSFLKDVEKYYPFEDGKIVFRLEGCLDYHC